MRAIKKFYTILLIYSKPDIINERHEMKNGAREWGNIFYLFVFFVDKYLKKIHISREDTL